MAKSDELRRKIIQEMCSRNFWDDNLIQEIPRKWENHGNFILLPSTAFRSNIWFKDPTVLEAVAELFGVQKLARKSGPIQEAFRRPTVELIFGSDPVVSKRENGIKYNWDITKCMFSSGNITEKQRISRIDCRNQVVVDLYSGIGYFTLTYLVHCKAQLVYACEWNPEAVKWLECNLKLNNVQDKCFILPGDNLKTGPKHVADHVNLGLIPSSEASWYVACAALKRETGGILHIHGNVDTLNKSETETKYSSASLNNLDVDCKNIPDAWISWGYRVSKVINEYFETLYPDESWLVSVLDIVKVKSYGPKIDHLVVDVKCKPSMIIR